jgi:hypothetical protein
MMVQVVAYQKTKQGAYVHADTSYFKDADALHDWCSGAVGWADRFRIFKTGGHDTFFEVDIENKQIGRWVQRSIHDYDSIINTFV